MTFAVPLILAFIFGAVIGSFLNVVSLRFNTGKGLDGRSMCMSCGTTLTWRELVPIASFIWQRGACRTCRSKISWQYPLVEFAAGAIFALVLFMYPPTSSLAALTTGIYLLESCLLLVIAAYDIRHKVIPDRFSYTFSAVALASVFLGGASWIHAPHLWTLLAGPILAAPFAFLWLVSKGSWMGLGDAKLALGIGWLLGLSGGANAIILAFWVGAIVSIVWMLTTYRRFRAGTEIPFGPYLILGLYLVLLFHIQAIDLRLLATLF